MKLRKYQALCTHLVYVLCPLFRLLWQVSFPYPLDFKSYYRLSVSQSIGITSLCTCDRSHSMWDFSSHGGGIPSSVDPTLLFLCCSAVSLRFLSHFCFHFGVKKHDEKLCILSVFLVCITCSQTFVVCAPFKRFQFLPIPVAARSKA